MLNDIVAAEYHGDGQHPRKIGIKRRCYLFLFLNTDKFVIRDIHQLIIFLSVKSYIYLKLLYTFQVQFER